jgi:hypothetical protein
LEGKMSIELSNLPLSGGAVLGAAALGLSVYFFGAPLVAKRTIEKSGWELQCQGRLQASLTADVRREYEADVPSPGFDCRAIARQIDPDSAALCGFVDMLTIPMEAERRRVEKAIAQRTREALADVNSACSCAVTLTSEKRVPFAIHTATLRLVKPEPVARLETTLDSALRSPQCMVFQEGGK